MIITEQNKITIEDIGKTYSFFSCDCIPNLICSAILSRFVGDSPRFITTDHNIELFCSLHSSQDKQWLRIVEKDIKPLSKHKLSELIKKSHTPDQIMFKRDNDWYQGCKLKYPDDYKKSVEKDEYLSIGPDAWHNHFDYSHRMETFEQSYFLDDVNIKETIKIKSVSYLDGELPSDILMDYEYKVERYEVKQNKIIGYFIQHNENDLYIPVECTVGDLKIPNKFEKISIEFSKTISDDVSIELKNLMVNDFKNCLEIEQLKTYYEFSKVKNHLYEENFKILADSLSGAYKEIEKINSNISGVLKKIERIEKDFNDGLKKLESNISEKISQLNQNIYKANYAIENSDILKRERRINKECHEANFDFNEKDKKETENRRADAALNWITNGCPK